MESVIINARVPKAKKDAAQQILRSKGLSLSDLVSRAVDYLIETKELPGNEVPTDAVRNMTQFQAFVEQSSLQISWPEGDTRAYKDIIAQGRRADYEALGAAE